MQEPRLATLNDIPQLIEMGHRFHAYSADRDVGFDVDGLSEFLAHLIAADHGFVALQGEALFVGMLATYPHLDKSFRTANEIYWWAEKPGSDLLTSFEEWGAQQGAAKLLISHRHDKRNPALQRLMRMSGYAPHEHYYIKAI